MNTALNVAKSEVRDELQEAGVYSRDAQLEMLRAMWRVEDQDSIERLAIEHVAYGIEQSDERENYGTLSEKHMAATSSDAWREDTRVMDNIDSGHYDKRDVESDSATALPTTDADWLSWKVNKFIKNIAFVNKRGQRHLRAGRTSILVESVSDGFIHFHCWGCKFQGTHYVGSNVRQVEVILARLFAHTYKH